MLTRNGESDVWFVCAGEAEMQFGKEKVKIYESTFTPMYYVVTETKYKCQMKLVCQLPTEKVSLLDQLLWHSGEMASSAWLLWNRPNFSRQMVNNKPREVMTHNYCADIVLKLHCADGCYA